MSDFVRVSLKFKRERVCSGAALLQCQNYDYIIQIQVRRVINKYTMNIPNLLYTQHNWTMCTDKLNKMKTI